MRTLRFCCYDSRPEDLLDWLAQGAVMPRPRHTGQHPATAKGESQFLMVHLIQFLPIAGLAPSTVWVIQSLSWDSIPWLCFVGGSGWTRTSLSPSQSYEYPISIDDPPTSWWWWFNCCRCMCIRDESSRQSTGPLIITWDPVCVVSSQMWVVDCACRKWWD